jgi:hypothetical protein
MAERAARRELEARAAGAEAIVAHLKLLIAKTKRDRFGASADRGSKLLDRLEIQLEELETAAAEDEAAATGAVADRATVRRSRAPSPYAHRCRRSCRASGWCCRRLSMLRRPAHQARRDHHRDVGEHSANLR